MNDKNDPAFDYNQAVEDAAQRFADQNLVNCSETDWQFSERAMEIARQKREEAASKNSPEVETRRLAKMNQSQFTQELREKYGIW
jgi:hypothetical protein